MIGLDIILEVGLSDEMESGLSGLLGLAGTGGVFLEVSKVGNKEGTLVVFPFSFRVLSLLFWRGVSLDASFSGLPRGVGTGGVFGGVCGGWSLSRFGGSPSTGSEGCFKPMGFAAERSLESGPPHAGLSIFTNLLVLLCAILLSKSLKGFAVERSLESGPPLAGLSICTNLLFKLCAGPGSVVPLCFVGECSLESGPPATPNSKCSKLCALLSAGPG